MLIAAIICLVAGIAILALAYDRQRNGNWIWQAISWK